VKPLLGEIMNTEYPSVVVNDSIEHCMELMSSNNLRYLPVVEAGEAWPASYSIQ
jgi:CBS domain-containing protein